MKANRKEIAKSSLPESEIVKLADVCRKFEALNLQVSILSVYETKETRIRDNFLSIHVRSNNARLVVSTIG